MAKVLCIDDFTQYAEMVAIYLEKQGRHKTHVEIVPFDLDRVRRFDPDVIVLSIVRKMAHVREPITDFYTQVDGAKAFRELRTNPETARYPLVVTSLGVLESEVPADLDYIAFVEIPSKFDHLLLVVDRVARTHGRGMLPE